MSERSPLVAGCAVLLALVAPARAERRVVSLDDALAVADANLPALRQVEAAVRVSAAQADEVRAPLLPQLNGVATYQRVTDNRASAPGVVAGTNVTSTDTVNFFNFGITLRQTVFDAPSFARWRASLAALGSQRAVVEVARLDAALTTRVAFFNARALAALGRVAQETLDNQQRHLAQVEGFVQVGTHPEIDLAQSKADVANAKVGLINAQNNYEAAKAALNQAMGVPADTAYDLGEGSVGEVELEDGEIEVLMAPAEKARPELHALDEQLRGQALALKAARWGYAPTIAASTALTDVGNGLGSLTWNWNFQLQASWNLFGGLLTYSQTKEAQAQLALLTAQRDGERLQIRLELERARLAVKAAKATILAATDALENARVRERLAEGRYQAGVGNAIELSDAVLALAGAGAQRVQADLNLATARAQLLRSLGRR